MRWAPRSPARIRRMLFAGAAGIAMTAVLGIGAACGISDPGATPTGSATPASAEGSSAPPAEAGGPGDAEAAATERPVAPTQAPLDPSQVDRFPTPSSASDAMVVGGDLWVDARPASGEVLAYINGQQCGRGQSGRLPDGDEIPFFAIEVSSDAEEPGCGLPGADVTLTIDGRELNEHVIWQPGFQQPVEMIAGPPFLRLYGTVSLAAGIPPGMHVIPYVGGAECGAEVSSLLARPGATPGWHYVVVVDPEELTAGCGRPGAEVALVLRVEGQPDRVLSDAAWEPGAIERIATADLSTSIPTTPLPDNLVGP